MSICDKEIPEGWPYSSRQVRREHSVLNNDPTRKYLPLTKQQERELDPVINDANIDDLCMYGNQTI